MDRQQIEQRFDEVVRENRFTISIVFPLIGTISLVASAEQFLIPEFLAFNPYFILMGVLVMRAPLISGLLPIIGRKEGLGIALICVYAYIIEFTGISTGYPYGDFSYLIELGPMIAGKIPLGLPVFFLSLVLNAYLLTVLLLGDKSSSFLIRFLSTVGLVLVIDLVLDPGAVAVGFWSYEQPFYYGVSALNYFGWIISGSVAVLIFDRFFGLGEISELLRECEYLLDDMVSFVILWTLVAVYYSMWIPAVLGLLIGAFLYRADQFSIPSRS
jgi:putative membrane protein